MNDDHPTLEYEMESGTTGVSAKTTVSKINHDHRIDPRQALKTQALVSIAAMRTRPYKLRELSRSGMFLMFRDSRTCRIEFEQFGIETGVQADIAFIATFEGAVEHCSVRGKIVRITREGIGVAFLTHNPPQLAKLRDFFTPSV